MFPTMFAKALFPNFSVKGALHADMIPLKVYLFRAALVL
jgi:hypothetical protein